MRQQLYQQYMLRNVLCDAIYLPIWHAIRLTHISVCASHNCKTRPSKSQNPLQYRKKTSRQNDASHVFNMVFAKNSKFCASSLPIFISIDKSFSCRKNTSMTERSWRFDYLNNIFHYTIPPKFARIRLPQIEVKSHSNISRRI